MSQIPKYPFRVIAYIRNGEKQWHESHNYETLLGAMHFRDTVIRRPHTTRVEVIMVLDESMRNGSL